MAENNKSQENQKRQFDEDQYKMLLRCSENQDMTEWNEWREANKNIELFDPEKDYPGSVGLAKVFLEGANLKEANLKGANLIGANLRSANLIKANLEGSHLLGANLEDANLWEANLKGANLTKAIMEGAGLAKVVLEGAILKVANLEGAILWGANIKGADFTDSNLQGAKIKKAILTNAIFKSAIVDGKTLIWDCIDSEKTDFTGVGLDSARVDPRLKVTLQGNIRRKQWQEWYKEGSKLKQKYKKFIVKPFWWASDYGRSTGRIVGCFFGLSIMFALFYYLFGLIDSQGIIANLFTVDQSFGGFVVPVPISSHIIPIRAIYFSIVTMTTLGFGDMYAQSGSYLGHILLTIQVLLGYVLLGALVTRFAILFTSSGPEKE
jgi:Pentapeptide repeats (8 copies)/Ion channel